MMRRLSLASLLLAMGGCAQFGQLVAPTCGRPSAGSSNLHGDARMCAVATGPSAQFEPWRGITACEVPVDSDEDVAGVSSR